ncbi:MAG TPA: hypothetical protein HA346_01875 [Thermoplasmata archaeon]|nr:hypothetical protein [Thermoplasmata archaeon]
MIEPIFLILRVPITYWLPFLIVYLLEPEKKSRWKIYQGMGGGFIIIYAITMAIIAFGTFSEYQLIWLIGHGFLYAGVGLMYSFAIDLRRHISPHKGFYTLLALPPGFYAFSILIGLLWPWQPEQGYLLVMALFSIIGIYVLSLAYFELAIASRGVNKLWPLFLLAGIIVLGLVTCDTAIAWAYAKTPNIPTYDTSLSFVGWLCTFTGAIIAMIGSVGRLKLKTSPKNSKS